MTPQTWLDQTFLLIHTSSNNDLASVHGQSSSLGPLGWNTKHQGTWDKSVLCVWMIGVGPTSLLCGSCSGPSTSSCSSWLWSMSMEGTVSDRQPQISFCGSPGFQQKSPNAPLEQNKQEFGCIALGKVASLTLPRMSPSTRAAQCLGTSLGWWVWNIRVSTMLPQLQGHCQRRPPLPNLSSVLRCEGHHTGAGRGWEKCSQALDGTKLTRVLLSVPRSILSPILWGHLAGPLGMHLPPPRTPGPST